MRWVFYSLFGLNLLVFMFGFFVVDPRSEVQFIEPAPTQMKEKTGGLTLLGETHAPSIKMSEQTAVAGNASIDSAANEVQADGSSEQARRSEKCFKFGPFSSLKEANEHQARIDRAGAEWSVHAEPVSSRNSYWVYLPAASSRDEALIALKSLQISGIDSYIVGKGVDANAISLGTFKKIESANALKDKLSNLGYQAEISEKKDMKTAYWAYLKLGLEPGESEAVDLSKDESLTSIISCEMFAQDKIIP